VRPRVSTSVDIASDLHPGDTGVGEDWTRSPLPRPERQKARSKRGGYDRVLL
jgi:hypothetical protein